MAAAPEKKVTKYDPNTEAFQMRAQWKKADNCKKQWYEKWSWLLDENRQFKEATNEIFREAAASLPQVVIKAESTKSLKPVPVTSTGFVGWIAAKPECALEIYTPWMRKIPVRALDAWQKPDYQA